MNHYTSFVVKDISSVEKDKTAYILEDIGGVFHDDDFNYEHISCMMWLRGKRRIICGKRLTSSKISVVWSMMMTGTHPVMIALLMRMPQPPLIPVDARQNLPKGTIT
jgi:hypothetical protein